MERSDALIKLVSVIVFVAIMAYLGLSFVSSYRDPLRTVTAAGMETRDGLTTEGKIVREEQVISSAGSNIAVTATEGAKISAGEALAVQYVGSTAMERAQRISDIQLEIRQLTAIKNGKTSEQLADEAVLELSKAVSSGKLSELYSVERDVDAYIFNGAAIASGDEAERIAALEEQLKDLSQSSSADTMAVTAPYAGTFSFTVDGYEDVSPEELENLTYSGYTELFSHQRTADPNALGKLVRGIRWYYVTEMSEENALKLRAGGTASLSFSRTYSADLTMRVDSVSLPEDGRCAVVFSSDKYMQDVAAIRDVTAQIVFNTMSGVSVPRESVHLNEDMESVVYVLRGMTAHEVRVNIIAESGDYYMVEETREGLRINDIVIVRARSLYDGAVVEK